MLMYDHADNASLFLRHIELLKIFVAPGWNCSPKTVWTLITDRNRLQKTWK